MKVAHIVPTSLLDLTKFNDYHLVLPHLLAQDEEYCEFYRNVDGHIILDNGVAEAVEFAWDDLFDYAALIKANEIVVPDVMGDCNRTIQEALKFAPHAEKHPEFKYMGVIQGKSLSELTKCLNFFSFVTPWVSVIALPRVLANTIHKHIRANFVEAYAVDIENRFEAVHCLGASHYIKEVLHLRDQRLIRGIDTSMPSVMGLDKRLIDIDPYIDRQAGFFEAKANPKQLMCIEHNLNLYVDWAR